MSERRDKATAFIAEQHPKATRVLSALRSGACWSDIHEAIIEDDFVGEWSQYLVSPECADPEACGRLLFFAYYDSRMQLGWKIRNALMCCVAQDCFEARYTRSQYDALTESECMMLSRGASKDPTSSYLLLSSSAGQPLSEAESVVLVRGAARNKEISCVLLAQCRNSLTPTEIEILEKAKR